MPDIPDISNDPHDDLKNENLFEPWMKPVVKQRILFSFITAGVSPPVEENFVKSLTLQIPNRIKNPLSHWKPAETREQDKWFHLLTDDAMDTFWNILS